jgi:alkanesulfonate monooxygenase SsuD/methylene tetrahydromethanopterin reductase-like flavin-dependent oxidoreductase (luciferase family)
MRFGVTFFPDVTPAVKSAQQYFAETFELVDFAAELGFVHAKIIEHYFSPYGGYSPDPLQFLAAVSQRQPEMRLMTGAVIPAFSNPLQLAAKIALLDSISGGRLDVGFARAFLPHEFDAFGVSMDDSRALYEEGIDAIRRLLTEEKVTFEGQFHKFEDILSYPRPVQQPHPPFYVAAFRTPDSFEYAGKQGMNLMITPFYLRPAELGEMVSQYRGFRQEAGHDPATASVNINFRTYCAATDQEAEERAEPYARHYINMFLEPLERWRDQPSAQYPGYEKFIGAVEKFPYDVLVEQSFIGSPERIRDRIAYFTDTCGGEIYPSIDFSYGNMPLDEAKASLKLFAEEVMAKV